MFSVACNRKVLISLLCVCGLLFALPFIASEAVAKYRGEKSVFLDHQFKLVNERQVLVSEKIKFRNPIWSPVDPNLIICDGFDTVKKTQSVYLANLSTGKTTHLFEGKVKKGFWSRAGSHFVDYVFEKEGSHSLRILKSFDVRTGEVYDLSPRAKDGEIINFFDFQEVDDGIIAYRFRNAGRFVRGKFVRGSSVERETRLVRLDGTTSAIKISKRPFVFSEMGYIYVQKGGVAKRILESMATGKYQWLGTPQLSPDGTKILFWQSKEEETGQRYLEELGRVIYISDLAGVDVVRVGRGYKYMWHPDGKHVIFNYGFDYLELLEYGYVQLGHFGVIMHNIQSGEQSQLLKGEDDKWGLMASSISQDGGGVVFSSDGKIFVGELKLVDKGATVNFKVDPVFSKIKIFDDKYTVRSMRIGGWLPRAFEDMLYGDYEKLRAKGKRREMTITLQGEFMPPGFDEGTPKSEDEFRAIASAFLEEESAFFGLTEAGRGYGREYVETNFDKEGDFIYKWHIEYTRNRDMLGGKDVSTPVIATIFITITPQEKIQLVEVDLPSELFFIGKRAEAEGPTKEEIKRLVYDDIKIEFEKLLKRYPGTTMKDFEEYFELASIYKMFIKEEPYLVWEVNVRRWFYRVDALTGEVIVKGQD
jgi:hypothetical protein